MIPNINLDHVNQDILQNRIENLEAWYIDSLIATIQWPIFMESCSKDLLEEGITEERKKALEQTLEKNEMSLKWHTESIDNLNKTLIELKTYLK